MGQTFRCRPLSAWAWVQSKASSCGVFIRSQYHSTDATFIYHWRYVNLLVDSSNIATKSNKYILFKQSPSCGISKGH